MLVNNIILVVATLTVLGNAVSLAAEYFGKEVSVGALF